MLLKGKNAVLTGCRRGIGRSILKIFAHNGANIWACIRKPDKTFIDTIEKLIDETNVSITPIYFDFSDMDQLKEGFNKIKSFKQNVDILVNNAGTIYTSSFQMTPLKKLKEIFEVNFFSQILFTQYIVRLMTRQKSGSIINISSSAAFEGNEGRLAYASSKSAIVNSTKVLSKELANYNIRVNAIAPGLTDTDMMRESTNEEVLQSTIQRISLKRVASPDEIANVALFLSSDLSSYVNGQTLRVDGGM